MAAPITISTTVYAPIETVWERFTVPDHITQWAFASDSWEAPIAKNDLRVGGAFTTTMAAKDKSHQFDFEGNYTEVEKPHLIAYEMSDGRTVRVVFDQIPGGVNITQTFDPESENSIEMQRAGWQAILDNFKKYCETMR
jgi:uncharacterized protein YndB with AHSA1/START domain